MTPLFLWWPPAMAAPDPDLALQALAHHGIEVRPADRVRVVDHASRGATVQVRPVIHGVPVDVVHRVRVDASGHVQAVRATSLPPARPTPPPLAADVVLDLVGRRFETPHTPHARLSWMPTGQRLQQIWTVDLGGPVPGLGQVRPNLRLDAATGLVVDIVDGAATQDDPRANVYLTNPVVDPDPVTVSLPLAAAGLSDTRLELRQCRDLGQVDVLTVGEADYDLHVCTRGAADGPVGGDYLHQAAPYPDDPARDEDAFAAAHTYHNVHVGLDWFDALGWVPGADFNPYLEVTVNQRETDLWNEQTAGDPSLPLLPYNNAYSTGGYEDWRGDWVTAELVFGQGDPVDYAYDADVVHHELGHFIVRSQDGPSWSYDTEFGPSVQANALNEGLADYFSSAIQGEGLLAEYAAFDTEAIRDLEGTETCMADLWGESHFDGLPFAQALWAVRLALSPPDQRTLDQVVLDGLATMGPNPTFEEAANVLIDGLEATLGTGSVLAEAFDARGVRDCRPVVPISPDGTPFRRFTYVPGAFIYGVKGPKPGYVQFQFDVPDGGAHVVLRFDQPEYLGLDPFAIAAPRALEVVGRPGDEILWTVVEVVEEFDFDGQMIPLTLDQWVPTGGAFVATAGHAGADLTDDAEDLLHHYEAEWNIPEGGRYTIQLANGFERTAVALDLAITLGPLPEAPVVLAVDPPPDGPVRDDETAAGCGCTTGPWTSAAWLGLWVVGLLRRR